MGSLNRLRQLFTHLGFAALMVAAVSGCSVNPVTGENQFSIISAAQEVSMGSQQYTPSQQSQGGAYVVDPELSLYVARVGQSMARLSDRPKLPYEFVVINNDTPNAWALPGGKIAINRGLLVELEDESQLAAVLGHEIVHAAARHSATQMTQATLIGLGSQLAGVAAQNTRYGELVNLGTQVGGALVQAKYGRGQELEADQYGMKYMSKAGYDPQGAVELQRTFVAMSKGQPQGNLFASHPPSQERVMANISHAQLYPSGKRNKSNFDRAMAQVRKDQKAYDLNQQALQAANDGDIESAKTLVQQAINLQPKESLFYVTQGQLHYYNQHYKSASTSYTKALRYNPEYYMGSLGRGLAAQQLKRYSEAKKDLELSLTLLPTQIALYSLGDINLAQGQKQNAIRYFQSAVEGGGDLGQSAQQKLNQLQPPTQQTKSQ